MISRRSSNDFSIEKNFPRANDPIENLLHVIQFDDEEEFKKYLEEELSWAVNLENR